MNEMTLHMIRNSSICGLKLNTPWLRRLPTMSEREETFCFDQT